MVGQMIEVGKLGAMFAMYGSMYMLNPDSKMGQLMKKPFIKFVCHSSSYAFFLSMSKYSKPKLEIIIYYTGTYIHGIIIIEYKYTINIEIFCFHESMGHCNL